MQPKNRVEALRIERGNLEELSGEGRIERALEALRGYYDALLQPLISTAQVEDYQVAINETFESLGPEEKDKVREILEPTLHEGVRVLAERHDFAARRAIYLAQMKGIPTHEVINRLGGLDELESLVGSEEAMRLSEEIEKEE